MRLLPVALAAALCVPLVAHAGNAPACWGRAVERLDFTSNPPEGGDNAFFTRSGGSPPMGFLVFANAPSMLELPGFKPQDVPAGRRGCANSAFLNSRRWTAPTPLYQYSAVTSSATSCTTTIATPAQNGQPYDNAFTYPRADDGCYLGKSYKTTDDFEPNKYYGHRQWNEGGAGTGQDATTACNTLLDPSEKTACKKCLVDDAKPYYISTNESSKAIYKGNFLHFHSPIYLGALAAWKTTIASNAKIIWGHGYYDNTLPGIKKGRDPNPACNKFDTDFNPANRGSYVNDFSNSPPPFSTITQFPLAQGLFSMGFFVTDAGRFSSEGSYVRTGITGWSPKIAQNQDTVCSPCQYSAAIVVTDGVSSSDTNIHPDITATSVPTPKDATNLGGSCLQPNDCGQSLRCVAGVCVTSAGAACSATNPCGAGYTCNSLGLCADNWYLDDVANYFNDRDARDTKCGTTGSNPTPGQSCEPEKQSLATYVINVGRPANPALNNAAKKGGTEKAFDAATASDLRTAFQQIVNDIVRRATSFSVAAITTVQTRGTTYAFIPRFRPSVQIRWEGHLYRYKLFNEFAAGCTKQDTEGTMTSAKLARNPNGDADCEDVYLKDRNNNFVGENDDGEFMLLDTSLSYPWPVTTTPGVPVWDGAQQLLERNLSSDPRAVYTVIDDDSDGIFEPDEQLAFTEANVAKLMPYLNIGGVSGEVCTTMAVAQSKTYANDTDCALDFIRFARGHDIMDDDEDGLFDEPAQKVLGDIFHSSPILVTPPAPRFLCDLGVSNQCVFSLYSPKLTPNGEAAWNDYVAAKKNRDHFVLVGANDGMVHAFHAGAPRTGDDPETPLVESAGTPYFDLGTGRELWAFIPPDMLPKLKRRLVGARHENFVDGTAMVRDIWVDGDDNSKKSAGEFHTVAVFGERQGGRSWFGLDVSNPALPQWRWSQSTPGSTHQLALGETWNDFAPNAPPIVPIASKDSDGPLTVAGVKASERYVVFLNGGYDPSMVRGRVVFAADAWTGETVWRFARMEATSTSDPRYNLFPVPSTVAVLDLGAGPNFIGSQDGLFDTALVGDMAGQLWTFRFHDPGDDTNSDGAYDNWFGARSFVQFKGDALRRRNPFFQLPSATVLLDSGVARAYIGSGDRANIRDAGGGECGLNNLIACVRRDCSVDVNTTYNDVGPVYVRGRWTFSSGATGLSTNDLAGDSVGIQSSCSDLAKSRADVAISCAGGVVEGSGLAPPYGYGASCDWGATTAGVDCPVDVPRPAGTRITSTATTENARYYSVKLFDTGNRAPFRTAAAAATYDGAALTDSSLVNGDTTVSSSTGSGFYVAYPNAAERTASGTGLLAGCVIWNTLTAEPAASGCGGAQGDKARLYRAHYVSGATSCGNLSVSTPPPRSTERTSIVPPPPPTPVVALNPSTGEVRYSMISIEPGAAPTQTSVGAGDISGLIYWLEVPRKDHDCRHGGGVCK